MRWLQTVLVGGALLFGAAAAATACEFAFFLTGSDGEETTITAGSSTDLALGDVYTLTVRFTEDHGQCKLEPEDTVFMLEEEKWKPSKDYLPLLLLSPVSWEQESSRVNVAEISFEAAKEGRWEMEVIRECTKGGYDEILTFRVMEP